MVSNEEWIKVRRGLRTAQRTLAPIRVRQSPGYGTLRESRVLSTFRLPSSRSLFVAPDLNTAVSKT